MNPPCHRLTNPPRHRLMKPRYCPEVSRGQGLNQCTQRLFEYRGIHITQHFTTATPHKYRFPSSRFFHIASI
ncbi:hypothetical protein E2C01_082815 [Portunus trituberculatus]|uniref:Uncharacterized protein n=1 Tax=Portunus trituberculatus TaxID=210409 RepID=A0A5B7J0A7_PORTR|nr:hypothetical protein [Portunus trituberculatus]